MRRIVTLAIVLALGAALTACGSSRLSPRAVRASLVAAALAQKSVHYVENDEVDMQGSSTLTADVTANSGEARLETSEGTVEMRLVNNTVYVKGDLSVLGLLVTRPGWIAIRRGNEPYADTALGYLTLASIVNGFPEQVRLGTAANKLPGYFVGDFGGLGDNTAINGRFSRWNEPVHVHAPARSTSFATAQGMSLPSP